MAKPNICLDTDVLIDTLRNHTNTVKFIRQLESKGAELSTTTINTFELFYGAHKTAKNEQNIQATKTLLSRLVIYDFDASAAELAGEIQVALEASGHPIGFRDLFIGTTAIVNSQQLLTRNIKHFELIPGLALVKIDE